jgi:steroid 5-alpha reductase family enzyme
MISGQLLSIEEATVEGVRQTLSHPSKWVAVLVDSSRQNHSVPSGAVLSAAICFSLLSSLWAYVRSNLTGSTSQVDMMWSILPPFYVCWFTLATVATVGARPRLLVMTALTLAWSIRMTYNFARKGGYSGVEDYRWPYLRRKISNPLLWQLFNLGFVSVYQNLLLLCLALPAWVAYLRPDSPWNAVDTTATIMFLLFLLMETVADEQQWRFQCRKHALTPAQRAQHSDPDIRRGFLTRGLFRFSRHPNFFAEQGMWWTFYLFAVAASIGEQVGSEWWQRSSMYPSAWLHWSIIGPFQLTLLFQGSTWLTEKLSLEKYGNAYRSYQARTSRLVPAWAPSVLKTRDD